MKYKFCPNCQSLNRVDLNQVGPNQKDKDPSCGKCGSALGDLKEAAALEEPQVEKLVRNASNLVVVDIYADWCGPCKSYGPIFAGVARNLYDRAEFVKLNADRAPAFSSRHGIRGVPATLFFKNGKLVGQQSGLLSEAQLGQQVQTLS